LIFLGGEHAMAGMPADLLPVTVPPQVNTPAGPLSVIVERATGGRPQDLYQTVPTDVGLGTMMKLAKNRDGADGSIALWEKLNTYKPYHSRITGYNKMTRDPKATVYAWADPDFLQNPIPAGTPMPANRDALLVGWQLKDGTRGRVLAFAAYDTYLWEKSGAPNETPRPGSEIHSRFWKQVVLWLACQEDDEGEAY